MEIQGHLCCRNSITEQLFDQIDNASFGPDSTKRLMRFEADIAEIELIEWLIVQKVFAKDSLDVAPQRLLEDKLKDIPAATGVYLLKSAEGEVLYVGKAQNLRSRVRSYSCLISGKNSSCRSPASSE